MAYNKRLKFAPFHSAGHSLRSCRLAERYEKSMVQSLLILFGLLLSVVCYASPPAKLIELTPHNMDELGFSLEVQKIDEQNYVRLVVPPNIDVHWVPDTTQTYTYIGDEAGPLNKVELGSPTEEVSINSYYTPSKEDLMVGVYYSCNLDHAPCRGDWDSRLYMVQSINQYLITKKGSRTLNFPR